MIKIIFLTILLLTNIYSQEEYTNGLMQDVTIDIDELVPVDTQTKVLKDPYTKWTYKIVLAFKYTYSNVAYMHFKRFRKAKDYIKKHNFNDSPELEFYKLIITKQKGTYERSSSIKYYNPLYKK